jgi:hypothetical protein
MDMTVERAIPATPALNTTTAKIFPPRFITAEESEI